MFIKMKNLAIITARGGSKRIPKKNIKDFCGKPILAYSIEAALKSNLFSEIMVSTDDAEIANIALQYGAKVPFFRSPNASNDYATTSEVVMEVLEAYRKLGQTFDTFCCIYPTAPFISPEYLNEAYIKLSKKNVDTVLPIVAFSFPPQRGFVIKSEYVQFQFPEMQNIRSQDLEKIYHDSGQFYFCKTETFLKNKNIVGTNTQSILLSELETQDIDTVTDWELAELKYKMIKGK